MNRMGESEEELWESLKDLFNNRYRCQGLFITPVIRALGVPGYLRIDGVTIMRVEIRRRIFYDVSTKQRGYDSSSTHVWTAIPVSEYEKIEFFEALKMDCVSVELIDDSSNTYRRTGYLHKGYGLSFGGV